MKTSLRTLPLRLAVALLMLLPAWSAQAWWNEAWTVRTRVVLDTTAAGVPTQAPVNAFPLAIRLHSGNFDFLGAREDGSDLRVVAGDDKTPLKFRIERFDPVNELALLWVQLPSLLPGSDKNQVFVYAGNKAATAEPPAAETGTLATFALATPDGVDLGGSLRAREPIVLDRNALLGAGAKLAGQGVVWPGGEKLKAAAGSALSWSLWVKPDSAAGTLLQQGPLSLGWRGGRLEARVGKKAVEGPEIAAAVWSHVALVLDQGKATIFVNGTPGTAGDLPLPALAGDLTAGAGFNGSIDQLEIAGSARSAEWLRLAAASQGIDGKLAKSLKEDPSTAEATSEGHGGYFGILLSNLTVDAWVIIIILGLMFLVAAWVMVTKAMLIARTDRANRSFLASFRQAKDDLLEVAKDQAAGGSSLRRLYEAGLRELAKRDVGRGGPGLSGAAIDAVKASIDADLVRETHHLNESIVLLTIAISGGPFLGLLGTVLGVMITFAAIAAAGDVNVNAIAPGIAAALLATVAGLGVAIPSLFGYNWLASRIKNITADMQIFTDEFITRVAELYGKP